MGSSSTIATVFFRVACQKLFPLPSLGLDITRYPERINEDEETSMAAVLTPFPSRPRARKGGPTLVLPPARAERYAAGKALRQRVPREDHGAWTPAHHRRDPVEMVIESSKGHIPELVPIRYGRMMVSPFTFYRGTANIMAADLASTPVSGIKAQLCGDAHLLEVPSFLQISDSQGT
jgi:Uncharacterized protein conserved in bacteria (DUF2252)